MYVLLTLDLYITVTHLFVPLRSTRSWMIPASATLFYIVSCSLLGTPEKRAFGSVVYMCSLSLGAEEKEKEADIEYKI